MSFIDLLNLLSVCLCEMLNLFLLLKVYQYDNNNSRNKSQHKAEYN